MSVLFEEELREKSLLQVAKKMLIAARTAPKSKGMDNISAAVIEKNDIKKIADKMKQMVQEGKAGKFFLRDADNINQSYVVVLIGTKIKPIGLTNCGLCGYSNCEEKSKYPEHPCAFNTVDLGIAIGSAVSVAMDSRVDNRIMFSVGMAARELGMLGRDVEIIYGIPLSVSGKNPFFDRK